MEHHFLEYTEDEEGEMIFFFVRGFYFEKIGAKVFLFYLFISAHDVVPSVHLSLLNISSRENSVI